MHNPCLLANKALLHAPTPAQVHTRHTTLVILLTIVKEEGWDMHRRVSQAKTRVSGPRLKRGGPQWGRISKQLGWRGQGLASQFAPSPHLRGVSAAQRRGRLAHTCPTRPKKSIFEHQTRVLAAHRWRHLPLVTRDLHILPICQG